MSDASKSMIQFLDGIPTELHEQFTTDYMTEYMKMEEVNTITDDGVVVKYGIMVAFARKS
jgi:hypothetical protein